MNFKEIQDLIKLVNKSGLTEFKMKDGDFQLSIRTEKFGHAPIVQQSPTIIPMHGAMPSTAQVPQVPVQEQVAAPAAAAGKEEAAPAEETNQYLEVKSPIVGTFYRSPSPDKEAFIKIGDTISAGDTVCIVEAMKLFNEIESEVSGKVVKVLIDDASPVEYDQVLFLVDPKG